ncbi:MAG: adaptor protein MecA [Clostridia bacterium]|nr:adaptor protein MecA [Clostridia bacterium]
MEYLVINDSKLKIIMTLEDAKRYGLNTLGADYDSPEARRRFWRVLDDAAVAVGFSSKGDKVLIQYYPSRDGGCEIFVTKLGSLSTSASRAVVGVENVTTISLLPDIFRFESMDDLLIALRLISAKRDPHGEVWQGDGGAYLLLIEEKEIDERSRAILSEFSRSLSRDILPFIREHLTCTASGGALYKQFSQKSEQ